MGAAEGQLQSREDTYYKVFERGGWNSGDAYSRSLASQLGLAEPRAVGDLVHVETFFARNLGGLIRVRTAMPDRLMQATAER